MEKEISYLEEGVVKDTISALIMLFIGIGVLVLVIILVGVIGGKAYTTTQADISSLAPSDANTGAAFNIEHDINDSIKSAFSALGDSAGFLGIIVLALVFFLVLLLLASGMTPFAGGGGDSRAF